jgi:hypothetical protein
MQQRCKSTFPTIQRLRFPRGPFKVVIKKCRRVEFREASLPGFELGSRGTELGRVFGIDSRRRMGRKELDWEMKTLCVICSYSETVIIPMSG